MTTITTSNLQKLVGTSIVKKKIFNKKNTDVYLFKELVNEMLRCESVRQKERSDWKVLVMDRLATRIISASCKMHDIMSEGITSKKKNMKILLIQNINLCSCRRYYEKTRTIRNARSCLFCSTK